MVIGSFLQLNYNFTMLNQDQEQVKLLVTFAKDVDIDQVISLLTDNYLFIQYIKKYNQNQILISFDSMSDLLEIDFEAQFGAISTKVRNSNSFCKEMNEQHHVSTSDGESSTHLGSCPNNNDHFQTQNLPNPPHLKPKLERLTSLEDEVNEEEEMLRKLALFEDNNSFSRIEENADTQEIIEETLDQHQPDEDEKKNESIWTPIVNSVVLTSLLVGGVKAIKFFFS